MLLVKANIVQYLQRVRYSLGAVLRPEVLVFLLIDLLDHIQRLAHQFLLYHLQQFVLLQGLTRHVQWQIIGVHLVSKYANRVQLTFRFSQNTGFLPCLFYKLYSSSLEKKSSYHRQLRVRFLNLAGAMETQTK